MNILLICLLWSGTPADSDRAAIEKVFSAQVDAWNKGDLEAYMQGYWQSDQLAFVGSKGLKHGWHQTLEHYKRSYPNQEAMGRLTFKTLKMEALGPGVMYVVGQWQLDRKGTNEEGYFSLIWKRKAEGWKIIADHSS